MLAPILQVELGAGPARAQPAQSVRLPRQGRLAGCQRQAAGARAQRHRHHPVRADRLRALAGPRRSRSRRTCSASSTPDGAGQYGLEGYYNSILSGINGHESTLTDVNGNAIVLGQQQKVAAENGDNLELGLDSQIQYWAELALANGVNSSKSTSGTLMIMDTKTGAIDAWAQYPSYNANSYASANIADFRDLAVTQPYEPGSIMKVITFAGGLNNNAFTPSHGHRREAAAHRRLPHPRLGPPLPRQRHHAVGARQLAQQRRHRRHEDGGRRTPSTTTCSPSGSARRPGSTWPVRSTTRWRPQSSWNAAQVRRGHPSGRAS